MWELRASSAKNSSNENPLEAITVGVKEPVTPFDTCHDLLRVSPFWEATNPIFVSICLNVASDKQN